ncbi:hypothetical protein GF380_00680 [Candidatus Uhrbacteria bacterium]|nr:hypothetical protein [Candidatus Uhrbacteria bacterium]
MKQEVLQIVLLLCFFLVLGFGLFPSARRWIKRKQDPALQTLEWLFDRGAASESELMRQLSGYKHPQDIFHKLVSQQLIDLGRTCEVQNGIATCVQVYHVTRNGQRYMGKHYPRTKRRLLFNT